MPPSPSPISVQNKHFGIIIALLAAALVLIALAWYLWFRAIPEPAPAPIRPTAAMNNEPESTTAEAQADALLVLSTSNELNTIIADLAGTDTTALESEFTAIEAELTAQTR